MLTTAAFTLGNHVVVATYSGDGTYLPGLDTVTQTVNPATLTVTANNQATVYGAALPSLRATYSGFVNGDNSSVVSGAPSLTTTATTTSPSGTYPIVAALGTLSAANYTFTFVNGTLTVYPVPTLSLSGPSNGVAYQQRIFTFSASGARRR